jgi:hypothetical protein
MYPGGLEIGDEEKRQVLEVLDRKYLFRYYGPKDFPSKVNEFEKALAAHMGVKHCLAVTNCTSALIDALVAVGVGPGDEVIVSGYTFFASCAAIVAAKAVRPARAGRAVDPVVRLLLCMCDSSYDESLLQHSWLTPSFVPNLILHLQPLGEEQRD